MRLVAVVTAVGLSRAFVRQTLAGWQLPDLVDSAELIVSELVTNAVEATGITDPSPTWEMVEAHHVVGVRLRVVHRRLYVEVWDRANGSPVVSPQSPDAEGGRGLFLVNSLSRRWATYRPAQGGKVVWSELALPGPVNPPPLAKELPQHDPGSHGPGAGGTVERVGQAFMEPVVDELRSASRTGERGGRRMTVGTRRRPRVLHQEPAAVTWAREKAGLTKRALALQVGISAVLMGEIESGWRNATPANLAKIAEALNCPIVVLERKHVHARRTA
ncbi:MULTISPECIES: ATP-binding protein [unclassified Streptomyces]|uniref:ATP-binding protein n=1 Tax=unclassified Streptomyces TaxID=2593676 RepID=UPI002E2C9A4B|nr:ATP-binding protein [Streptomyces sp. NBC_00223]